MVNCPLDRVVEATRPSYELHIHNCVIDFFEIFPLYVSSKCYVSVSGAHYYTHVNKKINNNKQ